MPEFGGVYSPGVLVFRKSEQKGYAFMKRPVPIDFVAVSAYRGPQLTTPGNLYPPFLFCFAIILLMKLDKNNKNSLPMLVDKVAKKMKRKIQLILCIGLETHHDCLVLSALGCGAYRNPPHHVAQLFKEVINENFAGCFKNITFAIFGE